MYFFFFVHSNIFFIFLFCVIDAQIDILGQWTV